jgi:outer membrane protein TolC
MRGITPAISLPVFEGGRLRSQLGNQSAIYDGAVEQYNATVIQAMSDVANAVVKMESVSSRTPGAARGVGAAPAATGGTRVSSRPDRHAERDQRAADVIERTAADGASGEQTTG